VLGGSLRASAAGTPAAADEMETAREGTEAIGGAGSERRRAGGEGSVSWASPWPGTLCGGGRKGITDKGAALLRRGLNWFCSTGGKTNGSFN
jgi:hypothetical protein